MRLLTHMLRHTNIHVRKHIFKHLDLLHYGDKNIQMFSQSFSVRHIFNLSLENLNITGPKE